VGGFLGGPDVSWGNLSDPPIGAFQQGDSFGYYLVSPLFVSGVPGRVKSRPVSAFVGVNGEDRVGSAQVLMDDECVRRVYGVLYPVPETQVPAAGVFPAVSYTEVPAPSATWERSFNDKSGTILEGLKLPLSV
jgi:hypothetical protein